MLQVRKKTASLDEMLKDVKIEDTRSNYITDSKKAVNLVAGFIGKEKSKLQKKSEDLKKEIENLFSLFRDITIENEYEYYVQLLKLSDKICEQNKTGKKAIVGFGGQFSAGKSAFINSISGIENILPEAQNPTTSIPTYIIKGNDNVDKYSAVNNRGVTIELNQEKMKAITHEFHQEYGIGFSSFIDSIIVESSRYKLPENISLLDTPGYSKFDGKSDSKMTISDKEKAEKQLKTSDYLIWLVDIDNGVIRQEDLDFIKQLNVKKEILFVLNKADKKTKSQINEIISCCKKTLEQTDINFFGITAYSSKNHEEYTDDKKIIPDFFSYISNGCSDSQIENNNIMEQINKIQSELMEELKKEKFNLLNSINELWNLIKKSNNFTNIPSIMEIWSEFNMDLYNLNQSIEQAQLHFDKINSIIKSI